MARKKWMQKAVRKPGALRKSLGIKKNKTIPMRTIESKISKLRAKAKGPKTLSEAQSKMLKRLVLARTFKKSAKKR